MRQWWNFELKFLLTYRKQRVTVCMAMLMLTIMVCGIFYHLTSGVIIDPLWTLGPVGLDARDVRGDP